VQTGGSRYFLYAGGNRELRPEQGHSFDAGIEFQAKGAVALETSIDVFQMRLDRFVKDPGEQVILAECADHGTALACQKIERFADGSLRSLDTRLSNYGLVDVAGVDLAVRLGFASPAGQFEVHALATNLLRYDEQVFEGGTSIDRLGRAGFRSVLPEWRGLGGVTWTHNAWSAGYTIQWIGGYLECVRTLEDEPYCHLVASVVYHDVQASYEWRGIVIRAGLNNLTNRDPPYSAGEGNTNEATYRLLGRTYFLQLRYAVK